LKWIDKRNGKSIELQWKALQDKTIFNGKERPTEAPANA
jgi:hypothetical protein